MKNQIKMLRHSNGNSSADQKQINSNEIVRKYLTRCREKDSKAFEWNLERDPTKNQLGISDHKTSQKDGEKCGKNRERTRLDNLCEK